MLHTWGQNLLHHPHVHCVVPGGGLSPDHERWLACLPGFFLPVRVLSRLFRRLFLKALEQAFQNRELQFFGNLEPLQEPAGFAAYLAPLRDAEWVVYANRLLADRNRLSPTSAAIRTASPSPISAYCLTKTDRFLFNGKTTGINGSRTPR